MPVFAYIGIGANLGDAQAQVEAAMTALAALPETVCTARSSLYASAPLDASGDDYINAVVCLDTSLSALALLHALQAIEQAAGRERPYRNAPRTLDLDLLLYGSDSISESTLTVPHPRMSERAFVVLPLLEIAPRIAIPGLGLARDFVAGVSSQVIQRLHQNNIPMKLQ